MKVLLKTRMGDVTVELFVDDAPVSVENFLQYVDDGHFDGTIFHRIIPGFMVQATVDNLTPLTISHPSNVLWPMATTYQSLSWNLLNISNARPLTRWLKLISRMHCPPKL